MVEFFQWKSPGSIGGIKEFRAWSHWTQSDSVGDGGQRSLKGDGGKIGCFLLNILRANRYSNNSKQLLTLKHLNINKVVIQKVSTMLWCLH